MRILFLLALSYTSSSTLAADLKWNCGELNLKFIEIPGTQGTEFKVKGCYQEQSLFLISADCQKNPRECLKRGELKKISHPGNGIGSPSFIQCYRVGGRPRFLQVKVQKKWIDTATCFFGSQESFMDFDTITNLKK